MALSSAQIPKKPVQELFGKSDCFFRLILLTKKRAVRGRYLSMDENDFSAVSSTIPASKRCIPKEQGKDAYRWME